MPPPGSPSSRARRLCVRFETLDAFRREFRQNLARGGLFVPERGSFDLREQVVVEIELAFRRARFELPAEIVSVVPPDLARAGGTPGVAVQLLEEPAALRGRFEPIVGELAEPDPARQVGERRVAPRWPATVVARISAADATSAARTRNLSTSGVLVSVDGVPPTPVGEKVRLSLTHPVTGQQLEVDGTVVRHVEAEGHVPALAIAFSQEEAARPDVRRFVEKLQSVEHARKLGGISGEVDSLGLANLIQSLAAASGTGALAVRLADEEGRVAFEAGRLRCAKVGGVSGTKALARMLAWNGASFEFQPQIDDVDREEEDLALEVAMLEAARQLDETNRLKPLPLAPGDRLVGDPERLRAASEALSKTEEAVVELAAARFSVRAMLDVIPEEDFRILEAMLSLLERGLVARA